MLLCQRVRDRRPADVAPIPATHARSLVGPCRACHAALEIQGDIAGLAAEIDSRDGIELALRIRLDSGQVITARKERFIG